MARSDFGLIQHLNCHIYGFHHHVTNSGVSLGLPALVRVDADLLLPCVRVQSDNSTSHKVLLKLIFSNVIGETLNVDVVVNLGLEPFSLLVLHVPLLLQFLKLLLLLFSDTLTKISKTYDFLSSHRF